MRYLIILLLLVGFESQAQHKSYILSSKGDTLNRVDKNGLKQGRWVVKVDDLRGERGYEEEGEYKNDQKQGVWRRFSLQGDLVAIESFRFGYKDGRNIYFNFLGELEREESWRAIDPQNPYDTVKVYDVNDPNKVVGIQVVKVEPNSYKHGTWTFYNPQRGTVEKTEQWVMNQPKKKEMEDDDLAPIDIVKGDDEDKDEKKASTKTKPKEVLEFEKKNAGKKKVKVRTGSTGG
ncbi:MAG: hypothetical protein H0U44_03085 [Flavisolibacter sp.]|jgi:hypothetical protein|nr:hypothetical protein [Flavisolibacter sp.]